MRQTELSEALQDGVSSSEIHTELRFSPLGTLRMPKLSLLTMKSLRKSPFFTYTCKRDLVHVASVSRKTERMSKPLVVGSAARVDSDPREKFQIKNRFCSDFSHLQRRLQPALSPTLSEDLDENPHPGIRDRIRFLCIRNGAGSKIEVHYRATVRPLRARFENLSRAQFDRILQSVRQEPFDSSPSRLR